MTAHGCASVIWNAAFHLPLPSSQPLRSEQSASVLALRSFSLVMKIRSGWLKIDLAEKALRNAIVNCVLAPGERLSESALATEFALGRGALRAALARLKASGLVSSSARSGWVVTPISAGEIRELSAARRHLEPLLFAAVLDEASIQRLNALGEMHLALTQRNELGGDILPTIRRYEREILELLATRLNMPIVAGWLTDRSADTLCDTF